MSPVVWVLIVVGGLFFLGGAAVIGGGIYLASRVARNPTAAIGSVIAAANPDAEVVSTDDSAGTITLRDKKTGEVVTMSLDSARNGGARFRARDSDGKTATMEFGENAGKLPSWVPKYPGAVSQPQFTMRGEDHHGAGEGGNVTFTTSDSASKVMAFYQDRANDLGMKVNLTGSTDSGGMIFAHNDAEKRTLTVIVGPSSEGTAVNLTYAAKH